MKLPLLTNLTGRLPKSSFSIKVLYYIVWLKTSFLEAFQRLALFEKWGRDDGSVITLDFPTISRIIWKFMWKFQCETIDSIVIFRLGALSLAKQNRRQCWLRWANRSNRTRVHPDAAMQDWDCCCWWSAFLVRWTVRAAPTKNEPVRWEPAPALHTSRSCYISSMWMT